MERLRRAALQPEPVLEPHEAQPGTISRRVDRWASLLLGRGLRFLLGLALLALFAVWLDANGILTAGQVRDQTVEVYQVARRAAGAADPRILRELRWDVSLDSKRLNAPVELPWLPGSLGSKITGRNLGAAALILLVSVLSGRKLAGLLALLGSALTLFGPRWGVFITAILDRLDESGQALVMGVLLLVAGFLVTRRRSAS